MQEKTIIEKRAKSYASKFWKDILTSQHLYLFPITPETLCEQLAEEIVHHQLPLTFYKGSEDEIKYYIKCIATYTHRFLENILKEIPQPISITHLSSTNCSLSEELYIKFLPYLLKQLILSIYGKGNLDPSKDRIIELIRDELSDKIQTALVQQMVSDQGHKPGDIRATHIVPQLHPSQEHSDRTKMGASSSSSSSSHSSYRARPDLESINQPHSPPPPEMTIEEFNKIPQRPPLNATHIRPSHCSDSREKPSSSDPRDDTDMCPVHQNQITQQNSRLSSHSRQLRLSSQLLAYSHFRRGNTSSSSVELKSSHQTDPFPSQNFK